MNNIISLLVFALALGSISDAYMFRGTGDFDLEGTPYVIIKGIMFSAGNSRNVKLGEGVDCVSCKISAPSLSSDLPTFECQGASPAFINGQKIYKSPCYF